MTFSIDDSETIERTAEKFELDKQAVEVIKEHFKSLFLFGGLKSFRDQYLSHLVRAMEIVIREEYTKKGCDNQLFQIRIKTLVLRKPMLVPILYVLNPSGENPVEIRSTQFGISRFTITRI